MTIIQQTSKSYTREHILFKHFGVKRMIKHPLGLSQESLAEYFLLGASFKTEEIFDYRYSVMIYEDTLHILGEPII
jgi:hypothetical protein